jgi:hypothetical protein
MQAVRGVLTKAFNKQIDFDSDALVWTLHTNSLAPNYDTIAVVNDLTASELSTGGGYTAGTAGGGGLAIGSPVIAYTAANSWATTWLASTAYTVGQVIRPATGNGFLYRCIVAGTSDGSTPTFLTVLGGTTNETGAVRWECVGSGIVTLKCSSPTWSTATFGPCRYAVLSDRTSASNATNPVIGIVNFGSDKTGGGGNFTINVDANLGVLHWFMP